MSSSDKSGSALGPRKETTTTSIAIGVTNEIHPNYFGTGTGKLQEKG
jgi:hypothetical protein